jgi:hypothetical protein
MSNSSRPLAHSTFRRRTLTLLVVLGSALATLTAASAQANTISFTLTPPGALTISAPSGNVSLGTQQSLNAISTISGQLGIVSVSDQRGGTQTWVASVIATALTPDVAATAIAASAISYAAGPLTFTGGLAGTAVAAPSLAGVSPVVNGSGTAAGTASWNPTISIVIPANFAASVYTSTITHSVA